MLTQTFLTHGQPEPPTALIPLQAGPLAMCFDPANGFVRRIMLGEREVLRGIYAAVRDHNWDTVPGVIRELTRVIQPQSFQIVFESVHRRDDLDFVWRGVLQGESDGTLRYRFQGTARSTFRRNRIGFCVLHPIRECAGAAARQRRTDGRVIAGRFPDRIEPQIFGRSSFRELSGVAHEVCPGLWAELEFEGEVFEMEDQRNWTDASFKTYCTPLALPFPVEIARGSELRQSVTLRLSGDTAECPSPRVGVGDAGTAVISLGAPTEPAVRLPQLGLGTASHHDPLTGHEVALLRRLRLSHLRVDLQLGTTNWPRILEQTATDALRLETQLEVALHLPRHGQIDPHEATRVLEQHAACIARVLALREGEAATTPDTLRQVRALLGRLTVPVGAGSDCNFCELNREHALDRLALAGADFLFWSVNPQVHAVDSMSVMETLEAQAATVRTAMDFASNRPLIVSPVTLRQRFNPVATSAPKPVPPDQLPPPVDPRQLGLFAAAWTLGSVAALTRSGAASVTYYETTGWRGVLERERGSPLPDKFPSLPGAVFPLYHVFAALAGCTRVVPIDGNNFESIAAFQLTDPDSNPRWLLANLASQPRRLRLLNVPPRTKVQILDAEAALAFPHQPDLFQASGGKPRTARGTMLELDLPSYALASVTSGQNTDRTR